MKLNVISFFAAAGLAAMSLSGCQEEQIPTYDVSTHYLHFEDKWDESVRFSFRTRPGVEEYTLKIPVILIGTALQQDEEYTVRVVNSDAPYVNGDKEYYTTASDDVFSLGATVFHKGLYSDVLEVSLKNVPELQEEKCIVLRIEPDAGFKQGPVDYLTSVIYVSDILSRPDWWNSDFETIFLGPYSDIKYENFIIATGVSDLSDMNVPDIQAYVRMYVSYLQKLDAEGTPLYEEDGKTKVLDTIVYR